MKDQAKNHKQSKILQLKICLSSHTVCAQVNILNCRPGVDLFNAVLSILGDPVPTLLLNFRATNFEIIEWASFESDIDKQ